jgi:hypothetical protein
VSQSLHHHALLLYIFIHVTEAGPAHDSEHQRERRPSETILRLLLLIVCTKPPLLEPALTISLYDKFAVNDEVKMLDGKMRALEKSAGLVYMPFRAVRSPICSSPCDMPCSFKVHEHTHTTAHIASVFLQFFSIASVFLHFRIALRSKGRKTYTLAMHC